jgi:hypothetical protein
MSEATTIGLDIAKHVFHAHGADATGRIVFSRRLTRGKLLDFLYRIRATWWRLKPAAARTIGRASCGRWGMRSG